MVNSLAMAEGEETTKYTLTLDSDGGFEPFYRFQFAYNENMGVLPKPRKYGLVFKGWKKRMPNLELESLSDNMRYPYKRDMEFTAQWETQNCTVTFVSQCPTTTGMQQTWNWSIPFGHCYGVKLKKYNNTDWIVFNCWDGHDFVGWFSAPDHGVQATYRTKCEGDTTWYGHWKVRQLTITFDSGGVKPTWKTTINYGQGITRDFVPSPIARNGYSWDGWFFEDINGTKRELKYDPSMSAQLFFQQDTTIHARWTPVEYKIEYDMNGHGSVPSSWNKTYTIEDDDYFPPTPSEPGYDFDGWEPDSIPKGSTGTKKFTANWSLHEYTLTFNYNDGASGMSSKSCTYLQEIGELPTTTKEGHDFLGWTIDGQYISEDSTYDYTQNKTATAQFQARQYTITFDPNGGTVGVDTMTATQGLAIGEMPTPVNLGYSFSGWKLDGESVDSATTYDYGRDIILVAEWTPITYTIQYNGNGATSGSMDITTHQYDVPLQLRSNAFGRTVTITYNNNWTSDDVEADPAYDSNHPIPVEHQQPIVMRFMGWSTTPKGEVEFYDRETVKNLGSMQDEIVNLYAVWEADEILLPTPSLFGCIFLGWSLDKHDFFPWERYDTKDIVAELRTGKVVGAVNGNDPIANRENYLEYRPTHDETMYAMWYDERVFLTLYDNYSDTDTYETVVAQRNVETDVECQFEREDYDFIGWSKNKNNVEPDIWADPNTMQARGTFSKSTTLYATWERNTYTVTFDPGDGIVYETERNVKKGGLLGDLPEATPTGDNVGRKVKDWWTTLDNTGTPVTKHTTINHNLTLYAHWTPRDDDDEADQPTPETPIVDDRPAPPVILETNDEYSGGWVNASPPAGESVPERVYVQYYCPGGQGAGLWHQSTAGKNIRCTEYLYTSYSSGPHTTTPTFQTNANLPGILYVRLPDSVLPGRKGVAKGAYITQKDPPIFQQGDKVYVGWYLADGQKSDVAQESHKVPVESDFYDAGDTPPENGVEKIENIPCQATDNKYKRMTAWFRWDMRQWIYNRETEDKISCDKSNWGFRLCSFTRDPRPGDDGMPTPEAPAVLFDTSRLE